jgi:plastocyanin
MGSTGKAAFIAIIVLGAITGIVMYSLFDLYTIPKPGIINSVDRTNLTATTSEEGGSTLEGGTTQNTPTTPTTQGGGSSSANAPVVAGVTITIQKGASIQGSPDYNPDTAKAPVNNNVVWVNEDTAAHTATSGTGASDPDSGKVFDTSIINPGEKSTPQELKGVKEGDEVPYYCAVHPYMTSKLTVTAASAGGATTAGNASSTSAVPANTTAAGNASSTSTVPANTATTNATTARTSNATSNTSAATAATTTTTAAAATLTIPVGAATPGNPSYDPVSLTVKKGDEIDVVNKDSTLHTVTSGKTPDAPDAGKQFDTSIVNVGASAKVATANLQAGEYDFHCAVHPFMMGKIIVQ